MNKKMIPVLISAFFTVLVVCGYILWLTGLFAFIGSHLILGAIIFVIGLIISGGFIFMMFKLVKERKKEIEEESEDDLSQY